MQAKKDARRAHMEQLKAARDSGKREYKVREEDAIYDEVNDEDYRSIVKGRLQEDDFIEDDDGSGYIDNGMDDWDREEPEEKFKSTSSKAKTAKVVPPKSTASKSMKVAKKPLRPDAPIASRDNPYMAAAPVGDEDDFMASLLGDLDENSSIETAPTYSAPKQNYNQIGRKRKIQEQMSALDAERASNGFRTNVKPSPAPTAPSADLVTRSVSSDRKRAKVEELVGDDQQYHAMFEDDGDTTMTNRTKLDAEGDDDVFVKPTVPAASKVKARPIVRQLVNGSAAPVVEATAIVVKPEPVDDVLPEPSTSTLPTPTVAKAKPKGADWRTATADLAMAAILPKDDMNLDANRIDSTEADAFQAPFAPKNVKRASKVAVPMKQANALEKDGSLKFWWYDMMDLNGVVYLIGKVQEKDGKKSWVSAMVMVNEITRKLYLLPRPKMLDDEMEELDDSPEVVDIAADLDDVAERTRAKSKRENENASNQPAFAFNVNPDFVQMQYSFGIQGIPRERTNWVEVTYPFDQPQLPRDMSGATFSHAFGTNTAAFERLVLERKIMGPCWLNISSVSMGTKNVSHCKLEVDCLMHHITVMASDDPATPKSCPPLTIMSLSFRTVVHIADNKREILVASARVYADSNLDDTRPINEQASSVTTLVRPLMGSFPKGFDLAARAAKSRANSLLLVQDEKALLDQLLLVVANTDPDIIVGLDLLGSEFDILLARLKECKCENWTKLSRFKRERWPKLTAGWNSALVAGRLYCDLWSDGSKSIITSTTWSLTEMTLSVLKIEREEIESEDTAKYFDPIHSSSTELLKFVMLCEADCYFQMAIAHKVQALLLARQLTNIAGNSWNKTLAGNRAERNEFILLHKFFEKGFIVPDKVTAKDKKAADLAILNAAKKKAKKDGTEDELKSLMKKDKFKGGLVFEPKRGLWDSYVLVMDFNSLYPSIIQEYDIDFTTMDWTADDAEDLDKMLDRAPATGDPTGILPQLIFFLVDRRRNVKKLMKDRSTSAARMKQYDITQLALKLTANSMYGCLGYELGRFYARPLAALTTFKGREILMRTKADAESMSLDVIYGDTDSVMINTAVNDYATAIKIGNEFKKLINDKYKKLEIDTDAVFERMLLLQKKKYAAVKVEEDGSKETEIKGLDLKRREYCELSKGASKFVLTQILSGADTETVIETIHDFLTKIGMSIRAGEVPVEEFIIFKQLGKNPQDYPDAKSLPHVQVAMRMKARGLTAKAGDVIPYIFCLGEDGIGEKTGKADKAFHPDELRRAGAAKRIDFEVYIASQVLPPIERLCESIEGTDRARLAECLGLDPSRYKNAVVAIEEREITTLRSQITDAVRFADATPLRLRCFHCGTESLFDGMQQNSAGLLTTTGMTCANSDCLRALSTPSLAVQVDLQIRAQIAKFYEGWLVCDDPSCGHRTRMMSVYGKRCLATPCRGKMHYEYTDSKLYDQLMYFNSLFDVEKARSAAAGTAKYDAVRALSETNVVALNSLSGVVSKHLDKNGRRWVGMAGLFSFMQPKV